MVKRAPLFLKRYFWDIDFAKFNPQKYSSQTILQILEFGNDKAVRWLFANFPKEKIKEVFKKRRGFSARTANFWSLILDIPQKEILCFKKGFPNPPVKIWPY